MTPQIVYTSKTQHYLRVKKPLLERQRRARINKCLDALKSLIAEFRGDDTILRMDKAEMLESTIAFMHTETKATAAPQMARSEKLPMDSFRHGYMNAVNEVSRVMAATKGISVECGKNIMIHLGYEFNRLLQHDAQAQQSNDYSRPLSISTDCSGSGNSSGSGSGSSSDSGSGSYSAASPSSVSSGYLSDYDENSATLLTVNKSAFTITPSPVLWRPW